MRRVISLWLPYLPSDRRRQSCAGPDSPLAIVAAGPGSSQIAALNRAAEACGLVPGLPLADARALCSGLALEPEDDAADRHALARLADWCGRYSPLIALDGSGPGAGGGGAGVHSLWLDITGAAHLMGGEAALLADLRARLMGFGFSSRVALADTPGAAWAVARYGGSPVTLVPPEGTRAALKDLPVAALRLPPLDAEVLARLGLHRIGCLIDLPRGALVRRFGVLLARRLDQALGRQFEPIAPRKPLVRYGLRRIFAEPLSAPAGIEAAVRLLLEALCQQLAVDERGVRSLELTLYRVDGGIACASLGTSAPARSVKHLMRLLAERLEGLDAGFGVDAIGLAAPQTAALPPAQLGFALPSAKPGAAPDRSGSLEDGLAPLIDRLGLRLGAGNVWRQTPQESHVPERATRPLSALHGAPSVPARAWAAHAGKLRPLRLLPQPEPIEAVALVPDEPPMLFRWRHLLHRVRAADGPERIAPEWWLADEAADQAAASRDYYRVEDERGRRFWLFRLGGLRPGAPAAWFLHGMFG